MSDADEFRAWWGEPQDDDRIEVALNGSEPRQETRSLLFSIVNGQASEEDPESLHLGGGTIRSGTRTFRVANAWIGAEPEYEVFFEFADGSEARLSRDDQPGRPQPLDSGLALLQPISAPEYRGVEAILDHLYRAAASKDLSEAEEQRILELADLISWQRRRTLPAESERWQLVGVVRSALVKLAAEVPIAVAANEIAIQLRDIRWFEVAKTVADTLS